MLTISSKNLIIDVCHSINICINYAQIMLHRTSSVYQFVAILLRKYPRALLMMYTEMTTPRRRRFLKVNSNYDYVLCIHVQTKFRKFLTSWCCLVQLDRILHIGLKFLIGILHLFFFCHLSFTFHILFGLLFLS